MQRPPGVTVSAVIAILGSLGVGALGAFMVVGALILALGSGIPNVQPPYPTAVSVTTILVVETLLFIGFAIFGIVSAVGLLRLRNWARISFLVFAGILAFSSISLIFGGILAIVAMPQIFPQNQDVPPGFMTGFLLVMVVLGLMFEALAIWWLIYFSRKTVKAEFMGEAAAALPRRGPLSVTIIAWILVVGSVWLVLATLISPYPAVLFGIVIDGWLSRVVFLAWAAYALVTGVGLIKWKRWAHSMAVGLYVFSLINAALAFVTGGLQRMQEIMERLMPPTPSPVFSPGVILQFTMIFALAFSVVVLWLLITRRRAFCAACDSSTAPPLAT